MRLDHQGLQTVLGALAEQIAVRTDEDMAFVVCGGAALSALGLVNRTTRDIDVLAIVHADLSRSEPLLLTAEPLPAVLQEAARAVARDFELPETWLNSGPTDLLTEGLPDGCVSRLHAIRYGHRLVAYFIDRFDQICFKTYAAINGDAQRHLADLRLLKPSDEEMLFAARWAVTQDAADFFPELVRDFLRKTGFPNVADHL